MSAPAPFELQAMAAARNYYRWLYRNFRDRLTGAVVEHGSGTGLLSAALLEGGVRDLLLTEPDPALAAGLRARFAGLPIRVFEGTLEAFVAGGGGSSADALISANVLEHVPDDRETLRAMHGALKPGGALWVYVPARPELFGSLDRAFHHHRRYRKGELRARVEEAGFTVERLEYRNLANAPVWWWLGRVLSATTLSLKAVAAYDRFVFPTCAALENLLPPPYGTNLLLRARRPPL